CAARAHGRTVGMVAYLARRLIYMVVLLVLVSMLSFAIIELPPGDYVTTYISNLRTTGTQQTVGDDQADAIRHQFNLDKPLPLRYFSWITNLAQGDMGYSMQWNKPVNQLIGESIMLTVIVSLATLLFTWIVAIPIGIYSATHQYSPLDYVITFIAFLGLAVPSFLLALVLAYFAYTVTGRSILGLFSPEYQGAPWSIGKVIDLAKHMGLPIIIIGSAGTAGLVRVLRATLLDELGKLYVVSARAKGLSEFRLLMKYPVRMAINPLISTIAWMFPAIISGSILTSVVLDLPMTGPLFLRALQAQDMYLAASFVMLLSVLTVIGMFVSDLLLAWSDPRIRFE
ncbi:MAG: ABC transporter permease, partial [Thermomicrobiales bacterium]